MQNGQIECGGAFFCLGSISADLSCQTGSPQHFLRQGQVPKVLVTSSAERQGTGVKK